MNFADAIEAYTALLTSKSGLTIVAGEPAMRTNAITFWAWKLESDRTRRAQSLPAVTAGGLREQPTLYLLIHFLILVRPGAIPEGLAKLASVYQAILDNSVIEVGAASISVVTNDLSTSDLSQIFTAAQLPLQICISGTMRYVQKDEAIEAESSVVNIKKLPKGRKKIPPSLPVH